MVLIREKMTTVMEKEKVDDCGSRKLTIGKKEDIDSSNESGKQKRKW